MIDTEDKAHDIHGNRTTTSIDKIRQLYTETSIPYDNACMLLRQIQAGEAAPDTLQEVIRLLEASAYPFDQLAACLKIS